MVPSLVWQCNLDGLTVGAVGRFYFDQTLSLFLYLQLCCFAMFSFYNLIPLLCSDFVGL